MIVARADGGLRITMQVAHQEQCGLLAGRWGNEVFTRPEPWEPVEIAAACHDEGWREWERHPTVLLGGEPRGFSAMDLADHVAIHRASTAAAEPRGARVALLVGMHGAGLMMRRMGLDGAVPAPGERPEPVRDLFAERARVGWGERGAIGEGRALAGWIWASYRVLQALDLLSLYLTWRGLPGGESWTLRRVPRRSGEERGVAIAVTPVDGLTCALDPWPFAGDAVEAPVACRVIEDRVYRDAEDLGRALAAAAPQVMPFRVVPAP